MKVASFVDVTSGARLRMIQTLMSSVLYWHLWVPVDVLILVVLNTLAEQ